MDNKFFVDMMPPELVDRDVFIPPVPPHSRESERAVLGCCLLSRDAFSTVLRLLKPDDFYIPVYGKSLELMIEISNRGEPVDLLSFQEEMKRRGVFDSMGGQPHMAELITDLDKIPIINVEYHARTVLEKACLRRVINTGMQMQKLGYRNDMGSSEIIDEATQAILELSKQRVQNEIHPMRLVVKKANDKLYDKADQWTRGSFAGVTTGFIDLDKVLCGLQSGTLNVLAARPSMGKTALALNIATFGRVHGKPVCSLFVSLETPEADLGIRVLAAKTEIPMDDMIKDKVTDDDLDRYAKVFKGYRNPDEKDTLNFLETSTLTIPQLRMYCQQFKMHHGNLDLIIIDYLQLLSGSGTKRDNRVQEVTEISRGLKSLAMEMECPILALSQLSREAERRPDKKPMLSDLRDSGSIEQDADTVMLLFREDYYQEQQLEKYSAATLNVAKNRNGPTDIVHLVFDRKITRFYTAAPTPAIEEEQQNEEDEVVMLQQPQSKRRGRKKKNADAN